jgi:hypothetical protein
MGLSITERLENGPVLGAEGYVFELERRGYIKAGQHHVRAMAEALGREVPAGKYSPSMDLHRS